MRLPVVTLLCVFALVFTGCEDGLGTPYPHQLKRGDIVTVRLDGQRVQVTDLYRYHQGVRVRVSLSTGGYKYLDLDESDLILPDRR